MGKSAGIDDVTPEMVKDAGKTGTRQLFSATIKTGGAYANYSVKESKLPQDWQTRIIIQSMKTDKVVIAW